MKSKPLRMKARAFCTPLQTTFEWFTDRADDIFWLGNATRVCVRPPRVVHTKGGLKGWWLLFHGLGMFWDHAWVLYYRHRPQRTWPPLLGKREERFAVKWKRPGPPAFATDLSSNTTNAQTSHKHPLLVYVSDQAAGMDAGLWETRRREKTHKPPHIKNKNVQLSTSLRLIRHQKKGRGTPAECDGYGGYVERNSPSPLIWSGAAGIWRSRLGFYIASSKARTSVSFHCFAIISTHHSKKPHVGKLYSNKVNHGVVNCRLEGEKTPPRTLKERHTWGMSNWQQRLNGARSKPEFLKTVASLGSYTLLPLKSPYYEWENVLSIIPTLFFFQIVENILYLFPH